MTGLLDQVRSVLAAGIARVDDQQIRDRLQTVAGGLDDPLRVAVVGRVKSGKSTLVNAMVGDLVAPTDATECTRIVTWYCDGVTYRVDGTLTDGTRVALRHDRDGHGLRVDLGDRPVEAFAGVRVEFPSAPLRQMTLVDTPGLASLDPAAGTRTTTFLTGAGGDGGGCDAVLYLLRHVHTDDLCFLEAFHDDGFVTPSPVNAIGVLSRADEIGVARSDAMMSAARVARRWRHDLRLTGLVNTVLPVAGLLAQAARTLRHDEFEAFRVIAQADPMVVDAALLSVDRFLSDDVAVAVPGQRRAVLLDRFGFFGCRSAVGFLRGRPAVGPGVLAEHLLATSGLPALRATVAERFGRRAEMLRARNGLAEAMRAAEASGDRDLAVSVERIGAQTHELAEARVLEDLRRGALGFDASAAAAASRLLGDAGTDLVARSGAGDGADADAIRAALIDQHARWQERMAHPLASHATAAAAAVLVRSCEGLLVALAVPPGVDRSFDGVAPSDRPSPASAGPTMNR
ncbi:MAG TPA: dynamin family protein [Acidimicrobiales bacterium]|nr:dynamin family protein [Acidimicrobiales bacterium]